MRLFINYHNSDDLYYNHLVKQLKLPGVASSLTFFEPTLGSNWIESGETYIKECHLVLCLISAEALLDDTFNAFTEMASTYRKAIIPIIVKDCLWKFEIFSGKRCLPSNGKALANNHPSLLDNVIVQEILTPLLAMINKREREEVGGRQTPDELKTPPKTKENPSNDLVLCYVAEDAEYIKAIKDFLLPMKEIGVKEMFEVKIASDTKWETDLSQYLNSSFTAILLVSPQLLKSDFIKSAALKSMKNSNITLLLLHAEISLWKQMPEIRTLQACNAPQRTLAKFNQEKKTEALREIYQHLADLIGIAKEEGK